MELTIRTGSLHISPRFRAQNFKKIEENPGYIPQSSSFIPHPNRFLDKLPMLYSNS
jgi:hypothetical protein